MKNIRLVLLFLGVIAMTSCIGTKKTKNISVSENDETKNTADCQAAVLEKQPESKVYWELQEGESISAFVDKNIAFYGNISGMPMQHMMRMTPAFDGREEEKHKYIDPAGKYKAAQIVVYYLDSKVKWPDKKENLHFFGTVKSMSGAGKGGGEHTEYYLMLDAVK